MLSPVVITRCSVSIPVCWVYYVLSYIETVEEIYELNSS